MLEVFFFIFLSIKCFLFFWLVEALVKQGRLFSENESKMDVDEQKMSGLLAPAKITLFQVESFSSPANQFVWNCSGLF